MREFVLNDEDLGTLLRYRDWFDNAKRIRALVSDLEELSLEIAESAGGWT